MIEKNRILFTERTRNASRRKIILLCFLFLLFACAFACAEPPPFNDQLKIPPVLTLETMSRKESATTPPADGIHAVYMTDRAKSAEEKTRTVTASQTASSYWSVSVEARNSPILEEHGNAESHESLGGLVKGTLHF